MTNVQTINMLAKDIAERFGSNIARASQEAPGEFGQLFSGILQEVQLTFERNPNYVDFQDNITDTFYAVMAKYDPQYDFWNFYVKSLKNNSISSISKRSNEIYEKTSEETDENSISKKVRRKVISLDEAIGGDTEGLTFDDTVEDTSDQTERAVFDNGFEVFYLALVDFCLAQKSKYSKKKTFNYTPLFFTDQVAYDIIGSGDDQIMGLVERNRIRFNEASDIAFLNTFVNKRCAELSDAEGADYLPLSEFTGKDKDSGKPCREKGKTPYAVIIKYLADAFRKNVTQSAVSQKRDEYNAMRISIGIKEDLI